MSIKHTHVCVFIFKVYVCILNGKIINITVYIYIYIFYWLINNSI
jgi:hypothetical protein